MFESCRFTGKLNGVITHSLSPQTREAEGSNRYLIGLPTVESGRDDSRGVQI